MEPIARVYRYTVRAAANLAISASATSLSVPCRGARQVVFKITATDADVLASATANVGQQPGIMFAGAGQSNFVSIHTLGVGNAMNVGPAIIACSPSGAHSKFAFSYIQASITNAAAQTNGVAIEAEVYYDDGADQPFAQSSVAV